MDNPVFASQNACRMVIALRDEQVAVGRSMPRSL
jgi:hypothetical protein